MTNLCVNSCCRLVKQIFNPNGEPKCIRGQGIFLCRISHDGQKKYELLTCHHVITSREDAFGFCVHGNELLFELHEDNVENCYSCCGENGILGKNQHCKIKDNKRCPFDLDFTLMELKGSDVEKILSAIELPDLELSMEASEALMAEGSMINELIKPPTQCCFYQRKRIPEFATDKRYAVNKVFYKEHYLNLPLAPQTLNLSFIRNWSYKVSCIKVTIDAKDVRGGGSSGAPIYATHKSGQPLLVGMHTGADDYEMIHRGEIVSINTNLLWVIQLLKALKDLDELSSRVLWAIFLQYEKSDSEIKEYNLLSRVAVVIQNQLQEQEWLHEEEEEMLKIINNFFSRRKSRYEELPVTEKIPQILKGLNDQEISTPTEIAITPTEKKYDQVTDTSFFSDRTNSDNDDMQCRYVLPTNSELYKK